jgi:hypothetical protein
MKEIIPLLLIGISLIPFELAYPQDTLPPYIQCKVEDIDGYRAAIHLRGWLPYRILDRHGGHIDGGCFGWAVSVPWPPNPEFYALSVPPFTIQFSDLEPYSDSSFTHTFIVGPGSVDTTAMDFVALICYEAGLWPIPPVEYHFYWECAYTYHLFAYPNQHVPGPEAEIMFCDEDWNELPSDYVVGLDDPLYIKVISFGEGIGAFTKVGLVSSQHPSDTVYVLLDSLSGNEAYGIVIPVRTLGTVDTTYVHGFGTVYGIDFKGDTREGIDWIYAGHILIIVEGTTPGTGYSFISLNQFTCSAVCRDEKGNLVPNEEVELEWTTFAMNDTSGNLSPPEGAGQPFITAPDPVPAPFTRGIPLSYAIACKATYISPVTDETVSISDTVVLFQDEKDRLRQEYIDTQKAGIPGHDEFRDEGSVHFHPEELRSSDYDDFLFDQTFLDALEAVRMEYGQSMIVYEYAGQKRAYLSPNMLFTSKPISGIGYPTYWEDNPESAHIYGRAIDIRIDDLAAPLGRQDDWERLAAIMNSHGIATSDPSVEWLYIHAESTGPPQPDMIQICITPNTKEPGWGTDYQRPKNTRQFDIYGQLMFPPPYDGELVLRVSEVPYSGGHAAASRPMNHLPTPDRITEFGVSGAFGDITYEDICQWGGQIQVRATYLDGEHSYWGADTSSIEFDYLVPMPEYEHVEPTGGTTFHPLNTNHYLDENIRDEEMVPRIVARFYFKLDSAGFAPPFPLVYMNDISLPNGGRFPIDSWTDGSHQRHRQGAEADMYYGGWVYQSLKWGLMLSAIWEITGTEPKHDPEHHHDHFHAIFPNRPWE